MGTQSPAAALSEPTVNLLLLDHGSFGLRAWLSRNEAATSGSFRRDSHLRAAAIRAAFQRMGRR